MCGNQSGREIPDVCQLHPDSPDEVLNGPGPLGKVYSRSGLVRNRSVQLSGLSELLWSHGHN